MSGDEVQVDPGHRTRTTGQSAPVDVHVLLADLYDHDARGYGPWGAGLRHRVQTALGWHDQQERS